MNRIGVIIGCLVAMLLLASSMLFTVDQRKIAVVYAFGEVKRVINAPVESTTNTHEGVSNIASSGLHIKLPAPFETVSYIDRRIQTLDTATPVEIMTADSNMGLVVDWFVKWQVVDGLTFVQSIRSQDISAVELVLVSNVQKNVNEEVARRGIQAVLDRDRLAIMNAVVRGLEEQASKMGIRIVDFRMRRVDYSALTAPKIFEQMITERKSLAEKLRAEGAAAKESEKAVADRQYQEAVSEAYQQAQQTMGEGDAQASRIFAQAFGKDPEFADFYRSLQAYRTSFHEKSDVMVLDPKSNFFKFMQAPQAERAEQVDY